MIKLLDCTLRDGGYYNNWDFSQTLITDYLQAMDALNVDFIEVGLRTLKNESFKGGCAFSTDTFINSCSIPKRLEGKIGVMLNGSELISLESELGQAAYLDQALNQLFVDKAQSPVSLVRIACHIHEFKYCLPAANWLHDKGYLVGFNLMQVAECSAEELTRQALLASDYPIDVLYFADSMGSLTPTSTAQIIKAFQTGWKGELGIHTHDNMGQAIANSLQAMDAGVCWLDSTVTGMGRGAGNAQTEYLSLVTEGHRKVKSNSTKLLELISRDFKPMQHHYGWGANPYYYLAGKYSIHPSYVQEMLSDKRYSDEDILAALAHLKVEGARKFCWSKLSMVNSFYANQIKDGWSPTEVIKGRDVLIVGSGPSVEMHRCAIERYVDRNKPFVLALNTQRAINDELINARVACHPVRLLADCDEHLTLPQPLITPSSMLPNEIKDALLGKELLDFGIRVEPNQFEFMDDHCTVPSPLVLAYALAVVNSGQAKKVYLVGFDGYESDDTRRNEVDDVFSAYHNNINAIPITSITPTRYSIPVQSIYGLEK